MSLPRERLLQRAAQKAAGALAPRTPPPPIPPYRGQWWCNHVEARLAEFGPPFRRCLRCDARAKGRMDPLLRRRLVLATCALVAAAVVVAVVWLISSAGGQ